MIMVSPIIQAISAFLFCLIAITLLARIAPTIGLVDIPGERKRHTGSVPVVGGIAVFLTLIAGEVVFHGDSAGVFLASDFGPKFAFAGCVGLLVLCGILDDRFHLSVFSRVASEVLIALVIIELLDFELINLGDLFGLGHITLSKGAAYAFTAISIFGIINAFNMLDGLDGLAASLVLLALIMFHFFTETPPDTASVVFGASLMGFLVSNLQLTYAIPKTFLGDAGSKLLGLLVACMLLAATSGQVGSAKLIQPATALFLVALPLFDMVFIFMKRLLNKSSPFLGDRSHIHHLFLRLGFSSRKALLLIVSISVFLNFVGLMLHKAAVPDFYQIAIFLACFGLYGVFLSQGWSSIEMKVLAEQ